MDKVHVFFRQTGIYANTKNAIIVIVIIRCLGVDIYVKLEKENIFAKFHLNFGLCCNLLIDPLFCLSYQSITVTRHWNIWQKAISGFMSFLRSEKWTLVISLGIKTPILYFVPITVSLHASPKSSIYKDQK